MAARKPKAERRDDILKVAWQLVAERGYHSVRVQDIAAVCGTSTGTIHYYFPGKDDILQASLKYCFDQAFQRQSEVLHEITSAHKKLLSLVEMQLPISNQVRSEWSIWLQFWTALHLNPELHQIHNESYSRWADVVVRIVELGQAQGSFRKTDPKAFATLFTSAMDGAAIKVLTGSSEIGVDEMRHMLLSLINAQLLLDEPQNRSHKWTL